MKQHTLLTYMLVGIALILCFYEKNSFNSFINTFDFDYFIEMIMIKIEFIMSISVESELEKVNLSDSKTIVIFLEYLVNQFKIIVTYKSLSVFALQKFIRVDGGGIRRTLKTLELTIWFKLGFLFFIYIAPELFVWVNGVFSDFNFDNFNNWLENKLNFITIF